jgi:hypothetical protein
MKIGEYKQLPMERSGNIEADGLDVTVIHPYSPNMGKILECSNRLDRPIEPGAHKAEQFAQAVRASCNV